MPAGSFAAGLIREFRRELGVTQAQLAQRLGVTVRTVCRWEASAKVSPSVLIRLRDIALTEGLRPDLPEILDQIAQESWKRPKATTPQTPEEEHLVSELLRRYRMQDPAMKPCIDQFWWWVRQTTREQAGKINYFTKCD